MSARSSSGTGFQPVASHRDAFKTQVENLCHETTQRFLGWLTCIVLALLTPSLRAASPTTLPAGLEGVTVEQKLGDTIPLDLPFTDEAGKVVHLRDFFHGRPVLLTLVYFECPMLCTVTLNQLERSLTALSESAGERFDIITVSFDPRDTPAIASAKKANYLHSYRRPSAADGWHFLTGTDDSIHRLTQAVGFGYRWDAQQQLFSHASAVMVLTPDGKLSRYFLGVDYPPNDVRDAINAADRGVIGTPAEAVYFYCFRYDPTSGKYGLIISRALKVLAVAAVVGVAGMIASLQYLHQRRTRLTGD